MFKSLAIRGRSAKLTSKKTGRPVPQRPTYEPETDWEEFAPRASRPVYDDDSDDEQEAEPTPLNQTSSRYHSCPSIPPPPPLTFPKLDALKTPRTDPQGPAVRRLQRARRQLVEDLALYKQDHEGVTQFALLDRVVLAGDDHASSSVLPLDPPKPPGPQPPRPHRLEALGLSAHRPTQLAGPHNDDGDDDDDDETLVALYSSFVGRRPGIEALQGEGETWREFLRWCARRHAKIARAEKGGSAAYTERSLRIEALKTATFGTGPVAEENEKWALKRQRNLARAQARDARDARDTEETNARNRQTAARKKERWLRTKGRRQHVVED